jgi:hypothetical protein
MSDPLYYWKLFAMSYPENAAKQEAVKVAEPICPNAPVKQRKPREQRGQPEQLEQPRRNFRVYPVIDWRQLVWIDDYQLPQ